MQVEQEHIEALHAYLNQDFDEYDQAIARIDRAGTGGGYARLVTAAFVEGVHRRFSGGWSDSDVVDFVARARMRLIRKPKEIDAISAEALVLAVLNNDDLGRLDEATTSLQVPLLVALVLNEEARSEDIAILLESARIRAVGERS